MSECEEFITTVYTLTEMLDRVTTQRDDLLKENQKLRENCKGTRNQALWDAARKAQYFLRDGGSPQELCNELLEEIAGMRT